MGIYRFIIILFYIYYIIIYIYYILFIIILFFIVRSRARIQCANDFGTRDRCGVSGRRRCGAAERAPARGRGPLDCKSKMEGSPLTLGLQMQHAGVTFEPQERVDNQPPPP